MTPDEFRAAVLQASPPGLPVGAIRTAIEEYCEHGRHEQRHIADCVQRAGDLAVSGRQQAQAKTAVLERLPVSPAIRIASRARARALDGWCREVRETLFGTSNPPFGTVAKAVAWIEQDPPDAYDGPAIEAPAGFRALAYREMETIGTGITVAPPGVDAALLTGDRTSVSAIGQATFAEPGTKLWVLAEHLRGLPEATGFSEVGLVHLVLAGVVPRLMGPRLTVRYRPTDTRLSGSGRPPRWTRQIVIELEEADTALATLRSLYTAINQALGRTKVRTFTEDDELLLRLAEVEGLLPEGKARQHADVWERIAKAWKRKTHVAVKPGTLRARYLRLCRLLREEPSVGGGRSPPGTRAIVQWARHPWAPRHGVAQARHSQSGAQR